MGAAQAKIEQPVRQASWSKKKPLGEKLWDDAKNVKKNYKKGRQGDWAEWGNQVSAKNDWAENAAKYGDKITKAGSKWSKSAVGKGAARAGRGIKNFAARPAVVKAVGSTSLLGGATYGAVMLAKRDLILQGVKAKKSHISEKRDKNKNDGDQETRIETQQASL